MLLTKMKEKLNKMKDRHEQLQKMADIVNEIQKLYSEAKQFKERQEALAIQFAQPIEVNLQHTQKPDVSA
jgi:hypothetical protein